MIPVISIHFFSNFKSVAITCISVCIWLILLIKDMLNTIILFKFGYRI